MNNRLTIDKAGRIVIPQTLRKKLSLDAGDTLEVGSTDEQITLRPIRNAAELQKEQGVWVFRTGQQLSAGTADGVLRELREGRDAANLGEE